MHIDLEALHAPVPDMTALRAAKAETGYRHLPLDADDPLFHEPLVRIGEYGLAGQAYYSRPNALTGDPVPGVPSNLYLRESVAEQLASLNEKLRHPGIIQFFGQDVELYIEDGWRHPDLQRQLWDLFLDELLRQGVPQAEAEQRRAQLIAAPNTDTCAPHRSGGAFDIRLRRMDGCIGFVPNTVLPLGFRDGELSDRLWPDYYEQPGKGLADATAFQAQRNRRALHAILTGRAFGFETWFTVNPSEVFHFDYGNLLWAMCTGKPAFYGAAEPPA